MARQKDFWKSRLNEWAVFEKRNRIKEILYGLITVLTLSRTISVSTAGKKEVKELLWAALGCNIA